MLLVLIEPVKSIFCWAKFTSIIPFTHLVISAKVGFFFWDTSELWDSVYMSLILLAKFES